MKTQYIDRETVEKLYKKYGNQSQIARLLNITYHHWCKIRRCDAGLSRAVKSKIDAMLDRV